MTYHRQSEKRRAKRGDSILGAIQVPHLVLGSTLKVVKLTNRTSKGIGQGCPQKKRGALLRGHRCQIVRCLFVRTPLVNRASKGQRCPEEAKYPVVLLLLTDMRINIEVRIRSFCFWVFSSRRWIRVKNGDRVRVRLWFRVRGSLRRVGFYHFHLEWAWNEEYAWKKNQVHRVATFRLFNPCENCNWYKNKENKE